MQELQSNMTSEEAVRSGERDIDFEKENAPGSQRASANCKSITA